MKTRHAAWFFLLLFSAALPVAAEDDPKKETILGTWFVQVAGQEGQQMVFGPSFSMQMDFGKGGVLHMQMKSEGEDRGGEKQQYKHDAKKATISIYGEDEDGQANAELDAVIDYSFVDGMLLLLFKEGDADVRMELTRKIDGTERHQKLRAEQGDTAGEAVQRARNTARAMQSSTQIRGLHQGAVVYSNSHKDRYPASLGEMLPLDYFTPEYVVSPWSDTKVPDDMDDWGDAKKIEWVNKHTDYVYLLAGKTARFDAELVAIFELPRSAEQEMVRLLFDDNHVQALPYEKADNLVKKQTGHSLEQWMKSISPGAGEAPDDEEEKVE